MNAMDVARILVLAAEAEADTDRLTPMRLQKLLYYVQGWSLAQRGVPMFPEKVEAWTHGPVVREVWNLLRHHGANTIDPSALGNFTDEPNDEDVRFIEMIWHTYKDYSATSLRSMSHNEDPWKDARRGLDPTDPSTREIPHESMQAFFSKS